jgi:hypothetical protein
MATDQRGTSQIESATGDVKFPFSRAVAVDLAAITVLWFLAVLLVRPTGEFPLNDDWSWGMTAKDLAEGKGYHPTSWTEMTLFTHALWGALFCLPQGFSFTALRISTLVLSLGGTIAMYALIRQLGRARGVAVLCALTLAFNPIYFALSNTYMADVPFTTLAILSVWFFVRHLQKESKLDLCLATTLAVLATLSRQMGLCLPLAFGLTIWLKHGLARRWLLRMILPAVTCAGVLFAFQFLLKVADRTPANTLRTERLWTVLNDPLKIPVNLAYYGWGMLMYLGWFVAPVILMAVQKRRATEGVLAPSLAVRVVMMIFTLVTLARFVLRPSLMPVHNNIIIPQGIGPLTLRDTFDLNLPHVPAVSNYFWIGVTLLSLAGAVYLVIRLTRFLVAVFPSGRFNPRNDDETTGIFLLLCALVYLAPFLMSGYFDRYLLPVLAFLLAFMAVLWTNGAPGKFFRWQVTGAVLLITGTGLFGVIGTKDYLEWNRARWSMVRTLLTQPEVAPVDIDGGFEVNGWYLYDDQKQATNRVNNVKYVITFVAIEGFEPVATNNYRHWLPPYDGQVLVLKRKPGY